MRTHRENPDSPEMQRASRDNEREIFALQQQAKQYGPSDHEIVAAMAMYGGSFCKALAQAWRLGDAENQAKIKATWSNYWLTYTDAVNRLKQNDL